MQLTTRPSLTAVLFIAAFSSPAFGQTNPQNFVAIAPCRITDTRISSGGTGRIAGGTYKNFTVAGLCQVPSNAAGFSLNVTAVPPGALLFLSILPAPATRPSGPPNSSTLNDPSGTIVANAAIVASGVGGAVTIYVSASSDVILDVDGYFVDETSSSSSTAVGAGALASNTGTGNTAVGYNSMSSSTSGNFNTAMGQASLQENTDGARNVALGYEALQGNTSGSFNTAMGLGAMFDNTTGDQNVAIGYLAASSPTADSHFSGVTAVGYLALENTTGNNNIGLGVNAGFNVSSGIINIENGNEGTSSDSGIIRIGTAGNQTSTYIAGIYGVTAVSGSTVLITSGGQIGTLSSSIRFKQDVHEMGDSSDALMQLRPVEFRYKQPAEDGTKPLQFGLVAEEVAKVYPELVIRGSDGQIDSVKYHELPAMLLNEIQKQHRTVEDLQTTHCREARQIEMQEQRIQSLEAEMEKVRALLVSK